jgi:hypothetical protein
MKKSNYNLRIIPKVRVFFNTHILAFTIFHCASAQTVIEFQNGNSIGYNGCNNISIRNPDANANHFGNTIGADTGGSSQSQIQSLVQFDNIFGNGINQIPLGSKILSADLQVFSDNPGNIPSFSLVLKSWNKISSTWNNPFSQHNNIGGIQTDNIESSAVRKSFGSGSYSTGLRTFQITEYVQAWSDGTPNLGFAWLAGGNDAYTIRSSEHPTVTTRPKLIVTFQAQPASASALRIHKAIEVEFDTNVGSNYQLQVSGDAHLWSDLGNPIVGDGLTRSIFERQTSMRRFYRVKTIENAP